MDFPVEITLKRPITVDEETHTKLVFDEPDFGTNIAVEEAEKPAEQSVLLLAGMAGVDRAVILKIKNQDYPQIEERVLGPYQAHMKAQMKSRAGKSSGNGAKAKS